jgi:hypothetical protein
MIDPIAKTFHRLGMQLPGCSLIPREDHRVAATGSGQIEPALAAVPSLTINRSRLAPSVKDRTDAPACAIALQMAA